MYQKCLSEHSVVFVFLQDRSLWNACERGDVEKLHEVMKRGANVNWTHPDRVTVDNSSLSYYDYVMTSCIESFYK